MSSRVLSRHNSLECAIRASMGSTGHLKFKLLCIQTGCAALCMVYRGYTRMLPKAWSVPGHWFYCMGRINQFAKYEYSFQYRFPFSTCSGYSPQELGFRSLILLKSAGSSLCDWGEVRIVITTTHTQSCDSHDPLVCLVILCHLCYMNLSAKSLEVL